MVQKRKPPSKLKSGNPVIDIDKEGRLVVSGTDSEKLFDKNGPRPFKRSYPSPKIGSKVKKNKPSIFNMKDQMSTMRRARQRKK